MDSPFVRGRVSPPQRVSGEAQLDGETSLRMVTRSLKWVFITALLLVVLLRSSASHQLLLELFVCAGAFMVVLALFIKTQESDFPHWQ
jgi:hypothetical protein